MPGTTIPAFEQVDMNSLNLLSAKVIGTTATRPRSKSQGDDLRRKLSEELLRGRSHSTDPSLQVDKQDDTDVDAPVIKAEIQDGEIPLNETEQDEKQLLLRSGIKQDTSFRGRLHYIVKKIADALTAILATIGMPVIYIAKCFKDESGSYSALVPFKRRKRQHAKKTKPDAMSEKGDRVRNKIQLKHSYSSDSLSSMTSDSDVDKAKLEDQNSKWTNPATDRRRSSRIRLLQHEDVAQRRKSRLADGVLAKPLTVDNIKSPISTSTASKLRYPHAPIPPRPLIPRRQPSYSNLSGLAAGRSHRRHTHQLQQKTLVLDLDETLIHSIAKGSRMSSGHMVEVKLNAPIFNPVAQAVPGQPTPPPQVVGPYHPILYYVHKRPHCDEFLRKICKWYKVVIFTASVQEYADPVIDWLEQEKKYFAGRYYRQHCTFRNGSYIKDLSSIEPDLSKIMILDNSPVSYIFHEGMLSNKQLTKS